jgi:DNA-binding CsgD family transcriptional regulator
MHWRRVRETDLPACLRIQPLQVGDEIVGAECALRIWKSLIRRRAFSSCVVESSRPDGRTQIIAFGSSVFVSDAFIAKELAEMRPGLNSRLMASMAEGLPVVLDDGDLCPGVAADGVDMVVLGANCLTENISPEEVREAQTLLPSAFVEWFTGFRLNRILCETASEGEREFNESSGVWRTVQRYPNHRALMLLSRKEAFSVSGSLAATLFAYQPPTLGLKDSDKELLAAALRGGTDREIADRLHISQSSTKKRWQSVFDRVAETRADLLPENGSSGTSRGPQKRHRILTFVQTHPSELRPFDWHGSE